MNMIVIFDAFNNCGSFLVVENNLWAYNFTLLVDVHFNVISSADNSVTAKNFTQVLRLILDSFSWLAMNWYVIILIW